MEEVTLHNVVRGTGWIEVVTGCMFSGVKCVRLLL